MDLLKNPSLQVLLKRSVRYSQAEGELAFENTTGIGVQSDYDSDLDRSYNTLR